MVMGASALIAAATGSACAARTIDPLALDGNRLTVTNLTESDWTGVEIWLNRYFRVTVPSIPAGGRVDTTLDSFVSGYGQRFDFTRMQVTDLRLTARLPDGAPLTLEKGFEAGRLTDALKGLGGKR
jgi:hypothetical protein